MKSTRRLLKGSFMSEIGINSGLDQTDLIERIFVVVILIIRWKISVDFRSLPLEGPHILWVIKPRWYGPYHMALVIWQKRLYMGNYESFFNFISLLCNNHFRYIWFLWTILTQTDPTLTNHVCFSKVQWSKSCRNNSFTNLPFSRCSSVTSFVFNQLLWFLYGLNTTEVDALILLVSGVRNY